MFPTFILTALHQCTKNVIITKKSEQDDQIQKVSILHENNWKPGKRETPKRFKLAPNTTDVIKSWWPPINLTELRSLLVLCTFFWWLVYRVMKIVAQQKKTL